MADETHDQKTYAFLTYECADCGDDVPPKRIMLGYSFCLACGEQRAKAARKAWTVVPAGSKQGYTRVTKRADLVGIYKGSTIK